MPKKNPFEKTFPVALPKIYARPTNAGLKVSNYMNNRTQKKRSPFTKRNMTINASKNKLSLLSNAEFNANFNTAFKAMTANVLSRKKQKEFQKYLKERERRSEAKLAMEAAKLGAAVNQANASNSAISAEMARLGLGGNNAAAGIGPQPAGGAGGGSRNAARLGLRGHAATTSNALNELGARPAANNNAAIAAVMAGLGLTANGKVKQ
jgi:hypothetical protein